MKAQTMFITVAIVLATTISVAQQDGNVGGAPAAATATQPKDDADATCGAANTQMEINECYDKAYQNADKELNGLYARIVRKQDAGGRGRLQVAQRAWLKYRDAHCAAAAAIYRGGSIQSSIRSGCLMRVTRTRTDELRHVYATSP